MKYYLMLITIFILTGCGEVISISEFRNTGGSGSAPSESSDYLKIITFNVGQGSATLVSSSQNESLLIDGGPPKAGRNIILPYLKENGIDELKYIIATHYHADHIGGIPEVIRGEDQVSGTGDDIVPTKGVIDRGGNYDGYSPTYEDYSKTTRDLRQSASAGDHFTLGPASVDVLAANGELANETKIQIDPFDENSASLALLLTYGDFKYLHASDITGGGGDPPYQTLDIETELAPLAGNIDVLNVAHHGSKTSSNQNFLDEVSPDLAIISVADDNDYGLPHDEVIERIIESGADIYQTEHGWLDARFDDDVQIMNGPITITVSDGDWSIE